MNVRSVHTAVFMWISEQTAIISLYNINWLVCITETVCVYCAVRTGYLNKIQVIFPLLMDRFTFNINIWGNIMKTLTNSLVNLWPRQITEITNTHTNMHHHDAPYPGRTVLLHRSQNPKIRHIQRR